MTSSLHAQFVYKLVLKIGAASCLKMYGLCIGVYCCNNFLHAQLQANMTSEESVQPLSLVYALRVCFDFRTY